MAKPKIIKTVTASTVLTMAAVEAMTQQDRIASFVDRDRNSGRIIIEMSKLYRGIEANLPKTSKGIFPTLIAAGVKKGTLSNISYVAKIFDLVTCGKITEAEFDTFTVRDCIAIVRVMSKGSKKRLSADDVAAHIKKSTDFEPDLDELYATGLTVAEAKTATDAAAVAATAAAAIVAADAKAAIESAAAVAGDAVAEMEKLKAENALLQAQADAVEPAPVTLDEAPAVPKVEPVEAPANIVAMAPPPPRKRTAADLCNTLDGVFSDMADLNPEEQAVVAAKLMELADIVALSGIIQTPAEQAVPEASKRKAA